METLQQQQIILRSRMAKEKELLRAKEKAW